LFGECDAVSFEINRLKTFPKHELQWRGYPDSYCSQ